MRRVGPLTTLLLLLLVPYAALSVHRVVPGDGTCVVDAPLLRLAPRQVSYAVIRDRDPEFQRSLQNGLAEAAGEAGVLLTRLRLAPVAAPGGGSAEILRVAARPVPRQVALIGVDSFDWRIIEPLMKG